MFDWKDATIEELALHILALSRSNVSMQVSYYKLKNNTEMLTKIQEARKLAKVYKLRAQAQALEEECYNKPGATNDKTTDAKEDA